MYKKIILIFSFFLFSAFLFNLNAPFVEAMTAEEIRSLIAKLQQQIVDLQKELEEIETVSTPTPAPYIKIISPNGGEKWFFGVPQTIIWDSGGIKNALIYLWFPDGVACKLSSADISADQNKYTITLQENQPCPNIPRSIIAGQYKISLWDAEPATDISAAHDYSDNFFNIISTAVGSLSLSLAPDTPSVHNIAKGSKNIAFLKVKFFAGAAEDMRVNSIQVYAYKNGVSTPAQSAEITNLKLFDGLTQIGLTQPHTSEGVTTFSALNWIIPKGTAKTLTVLADVPSTEVVALQLAIAGGTKLNVAGVSSGRPVLTQGFASGNIMTLVPFGSLSLSLSNATPVGADIKKGKKYLDFAKINFLAGDAEAIDISSIAVKREGCSDADFLNLRLYDGASQIDKEAYLADGEAVFELPVGSFWRVPAGSAKVLTIKADISTLNPASCLSRLCFASDGTNLKTSAQGAVSAITINATGSASLCGSYFNLIGLEPSITLNSPNGGEKLVKGKTADIKWTSTGLGTGGVAVNVSLWKINSDSSFSLSQTIALDLPPSQGQYSWTIPSTMGTGRYKIALYASTVAKSDESNSYFSIVDEPKKSPLSLESQLADISKAISDMIKKLDTLKQK